jgi:hypothetical protein
MLIPIFRIKMFIKALAHAFARHISVVRLHRKITDATETKEDESETLSLF